MKPLLITVAALLLTGFVTIDLQLTPKEREAAIAELTTTQNDLNSTLEDLSDDQLNYKSSPDSWSIAECVEHLAISENNIFGMLQGAIQTPADPSKRSEVKMSDEEILAIIRDRSTKVKTQKPFEPTGKYGSFEATLKEFNSKRKDHINYIKNTKDDLRNHYAQLPFGTIDGYQVLLFMSGHVKRHTAQIEEIMADEDFPEE